MTSYEEYHKTNDTINLWFVDLHLKKKKEIYDKYKEAIK